MNLLFMQNGLAPYGIPRNGLIALFDPGRQILTGTTGQTLVDFTGKGNSAQLGSAVGVDTNDPAWSGNGLVFGADDYISSITLPAKGTIICVASIDTSQNAGIYGTINIAANHLYFYYHASYNLVMLAISDTAGTATGLRPTGTNKPTIYALKYGDGVANAFLNTSKSANKTYNTWGTMPQLYFGRSGDIYNAGHQYCYVVYNRALSDAEYLQAYNGLRRLMNSRGVVI